MYGYRFQNDAPPKQDPPAQEKPAVPAFDELFPDGPQLCHVSVPVIMSTAVEAESHKHAMHKVIGQIESAPFYQVGMQESVMDAEFCRVELEGNCMSLPLIAVANLPEGQVIPKNKLYDVAAEIVKAFNERLAAEGLSLTVLLPHSSIATHQDTI